MVVSKIKLEPVLMCVRSVILFIKSCEHTQVTCADPEFCQRESNFDNVFLVDEERDDPNTTKSWPSWAH